MLYFHDYVLKPQYRIVEAMIKYAPYVHGTEYMPKRRYPVLSRWLPAHQRDNNWTSKQLAQRIKMENASQLPLN